MSKPERYEEEPYPRPRAVEPVARPTSTAAVISAVLGVLGLLAVFVNIGGVLGPVIGIFLSVLAIVFGAVGAGQVLSGTRTGSVWAAVGIILGLVGLTLGILAAVFGIVVFSVDLVS